MRRFTRGLFFSCPVCGSEEHPVPDGELCPECRKSLSFFSAKIRCSGCGGENDTFLPLCPQCLDEPPRPWHEAYSIFAYRGAGRSLIRQYKFRHCSEIALPLGILGAELLKNYEIDCDLIVPVPLNFLREMVRGYNQAELFARVISRKSGIPFANLLNSRFSFTNQRNRDRKERHKAIKKQFSLRHRVPSGSRILLVDDIFTTGATLHAAAELLLEAGAGSVTVLTAARRERLFQKNPGV